MNKNIRILHYLTSKVCCGGIENFLINVYKNIDTKKIQFDFIGYWSENNVFDNEIIKRGGKIYKLNFPIKNIYNHIKELEKFFKEHKEYKIIHIHSDYAISYFAVKLAKKYGLTVILHSHQTNVMKKKILIHKIFKRYQSEIIDVKMACSKMAAEWMFTKNDNKKNIVYIIKNAIDIKKFEYNEQMRLNLRKIMNMENKFVIGNVGRLSPQKNQKFLINIFYEICKMNANSVLLIIGDGKLEKKLKKQVDKLNLNSKVVFLKNISNIEDYYNAMDVFVLPSLYEGLGIVNIEAQANGLKTVVSDKIPFEANTVNQNFISIPLKNNAKYWAMEILKYNNYYARNNFSNLIEIKGYSIQEVANELENIYINIIKNSERKKI